MNGLVDFLNGVVEQLGMWRSAGPGIIVDSLPMYNQAVSAWESIETD